MKWTLLVPAGALALACGGGGKPGALADVDAALPGSPVDVTPPPDGGTGDGAGADGTVIEGGGPALGPIPIVDEPDVPCVPGGGTTAVIYPSASSPPLISRLRAVGTRRAGGGEDLDGFVTFDPLGTNAQATPATIGTNQASFDTEGTTIGMAGGDATTVVYRRFDAQGAPVANPLLLAQALTSIPQAVTLGSGGGGSLVVWGSGGSLHGVGITPAGAVAGPVFDFAPGAYHTTLFVSIAYNGASFGIAWTGDPNANAKDPTTRSSFVTASLTGLLGTPTEITTAASVFQLVRFIATPTGYGALYNGLAEDEIYYVPLDAAGKVAGSAHRFLGGDVPWDIVAQGSEIGLAVQRLNENDSGLPELYQPMFRALDASGAPIAPWVCLTSAPLPGGTPLHMALDKDGSGYVATYRTPSNDQVLTRFDRLGTGP